MVTKQSQIRMNVDDFDEAFELLSAHGFKNVQGDKVSESSTSKGTALLKAKGKAEKEKEKVKEAEEKKKLGSSIC